MNTNWDPTPWRDGGFGSDAEEETEAVTGLTEAGRKYPKVLPPKGAPTPPTLKN